MFVCSLWNSGEQGRVFLLQ
ncbi:hypothetical protein LINPERPRIM_LOCUS24615 [Linum perenne]